MFNLFKSNNILEMVSPLTGRAMPITECPDPVFGDKVLGDGVAVEPTQGTVYSPVDGSVFQIAHTFHALGIASDDGLEILIHLGLDTVGLKGEGFSCLVEVGQKVKKGDKLMEMDIDLIKGRGLSTISPCIITNLDAIKSMELCLGEVKGGESAVILYKK